MTPVFGARRRAEEFHSLVEDTSTGGLHDARYADFLDIVASLRDTPAAQPRPEFVSGLRERLMIEAETVLVVSDEEARLRLPSRQKSRRPTFHDSEHQTVLQAELMLLACFFRCVVGSRPARLQPAVG